MIKTLRITSVLAAALAVVVFSLSVVYGMRTDPAIEELLKSPGVIAKFSQDAGTRTRRTDDQSSPLEKQAHLFALYLNPPAKPKPPERTVARTTPVPARVIPQGPVSAKFRLIGTSVHHSDPNMSLAFIDEPGIGLHWVRQSSNIMHLDIVEVKDGVVVVRDGQRTFEVPAEPRRVAVDLEGTPGSRPTAVATSTPTRNVGTFSPVSMANRTVVTPRTEVQRAAPPEPVMDEQKSAEILSLMERLQSIQEAEKTGSVDSNEAARTKEKIMSNFRASQVSEEEAKKLNNLGRQLDQDDRESPENPRRPGSKIDGSIPRRPPISQRRSIPRSPNSQ